MTYIAIALGGVLGALARYVFGGWVQAHAGTTFPWGTLAVNTTGSLLLGFLAHFLEGVIAPPEWRMFATIGFCGAYTTFSTFTYESVRMLQTGEWKLAFAYMSSSMLLGLFAMFAGLRVAEVALRS